MALIPCSACQQQVSDKAAFCPYCGNPVQNVKNLEIAATQVKDLLPTSMTQNEIARPTSRKRMLLTSSIALGIVIFVGGALYGATQVNLFSSPKEILLTAVNTLDPVSAPSLPTSFSGTLSFKLNNIVSTSLQERQSVSSWDGSSLSFSYALDPQKDKGMIQGILLNQQGSDEMTMWINDQDIIAKVNGLQKLIDQITKESGLNIPIPSLPEYIDLGQGYAQPLRTFWNVLHQGNTLTAYQLHAERDIMSMLIQSIPSQDITRNGLLGLTIRLNQNSVLPIVDAFLQQIQQHKSMFVHDINTLNAMNRKANTAPLTQATIDSLSFTQLQSSINKAIHAGVITLLPTSITLQKSLFGNGFTFHVATGLAENKPDVFNGISASLGMNLSGQTPSTSAIKVPVLTARNSKTWADYMQSMNTSLGNPFSQNQYGVSSLPSHEQYGGTVTFRGSDGSTSILPVIGIKASYGINMTPSMIPSQPLSPIKFSLPPNQASQLALYWVNEGYNNQGYTFLGPRNWLVKDAGIGADGSESFTLQSPNGSQSMTVRDDGACQGCSISDMGSYFPNLNAWAKKQEVGFNTASLPFIAYHVINPNTSVYEIQHKGTTLPSYGIAYQEHYKNGGVYFSQEEVTMSPQNPLANTLLSFYLSKL